MSHYYWKPPDSVISFNNSLPSVRYREEVMISTGFDSSSHCQMMLRLCAFFSELSGLSHMHPYCEVPGRASNPFAVFDPVCFRTWISRLSNQLIGWFVLNGPVIILIVLRDPDRATIWIQKFEATQILGETLQAHPAELWEMFIHNHERNFLTS